MKIIDDGSLPRDVVFTVDAPLNGETLVCFNPGYDKNEYRREIKTAVKACSKLVGLGLAAFMELNLR
jgi:hypothetical protein